LPMFAKVTLTGFVVVERRRQEPANI